jgi:TatD DNase family protein
VKTEGEVNSRSRVEIVDTHCHLFLMKDEPGGIVEAARRSGVVTLVCAGVDAESSRQSREMADAIAGVFATAGVHPHTASEFDAYAGSEVEALLADPRVVAVGETGLDYFRMNSPPDDQRKAFRAHCGLARETGKPIVVHTREAWDDVLAILEEEAVERVVLHCFSGDATIAKEVSARRYFCSFAGNLSYPKNEALRLATAEIPSDLLLVETDSPFLAPQSLRGRDNEPANIRLVVEALADARGEEPGEIAAVTTRNARVAFALPS